MRCPGRGTGERDRWPVAAAWPRSGAARRRHHVPPRYGDLDRV